MTNLTARVTAGEHPPPHAGSPGSDGSLARRRALRLIDLEPPEDAPGLAGALSRLCCAVTHDLHLAGTTATVVPEGGCHAVTAASSPSIRRIEQLQVDAGEGPSRHSFLTGEPVVVADLRAAVARWPDFTASAAAAGMSAVAALPLRVGAATLGALTLYWGRGPGPTYEELRSAMVFADLSTELVIDSSYSDGGRGPDVELHSALHADENIYLAQGMVMVALGVSLPEALARMRAHASATDQDLDSVVQRIVAGERVLVRDPQ